MENKEYVFVYGTLKFGYSNSGFLANSQIIGRATTNNLFTLYEHGLPYLTQKATHQVKGEVYKVSYKTMLHLDMLEGHPDLYERQMISVTLEDKQKVRAWCYFYKHPMRENFILTKGEYKENNYGIKF